MPPLPSPPWKRKHKKGHWKEEVFIQNILVISEYILEEGMQKSIQFVWADKATGKAKAFIRHTLFLSMASFDHGVP